MRILRVIGHVMWVLPLVAFLIWLFIYLQITNEEWMQLVYAITGGLIALAYWFVMLWCLFHKRPPTKVSKLTCGEIV